jgi:hypothetical protein
MAAPDLQPNDPPTATDPAYDAFAQQLSQLWQQHYNRLPDKREIDEMYASGKGIDWIAAQFQAPPSAAPPAPPPAGGNTGGPAAPGIGYGPLTAPFSTPWAPTANTPYPTQPTFSFKDFTAPSYTEAQNDPGYQFRLGQGQHLLENSRAGAGILNTGMTLKDILDYGQNAASQEYGNVYNRAANTYNLNLGTAQAEFAPLMSGWQTNMAATQRGNEFANTQSLRKWEDDAANFRNWQNDAWQKYFAGASA